MDIVFTMSFILPTRPFRIWSPTFRALIKQKRKSDPKVDDAQDGGRAIVVEEGLTAWVSHKRSN